ncbi:MAG: hypothetical protein HN348_29135, partial [Proteobacteria bacterium]|nr:hypothetical protein [Pseudomonadota bacterium]
FHHDEADGKWIEWYEDGTIMLKGAKRSNKFSGPIEEWHMTGHKKLIGEYDQGDLIGNVSYFARSGRKTEEAQFRGGVRHGISRIYDRDDEVRATQCFQYGERQWVSSERKLPECPDQFGVVFRPAIQEGRSFSDGFAAVKIGSKWGYINEQGRVVISPQFENVRPFVGGMAGVTSDGKVWYAVDKTGTKIHDVRPPGAGASGSTRGILLGQTNGLVDYFKGGKSLWASSESAPVHDMDPLFPVVKEGKWGFIDVGGEIEVPLEYQFVGEYSEGLAAVGIRGWIGYIDKSGNMMIHARFDEGRPFNCGMAAVKGPEGLIYIDHHGLRVTQATLKTVSNCTEGLAKVKVDDSYGFLHNSGRMMIAPRFPSVETFQEGYAAVSDENTYIDRTGRSVYTRVVPMTPFSEGKAVANQRVGAVNKYVVLKTDGSFDTVKHEISRTDSVEFGPYTQGLSAIVLGSGAGFINAKGEVVVELKYKRTRPFSDGLAAALTDEGWGFIDKGGKVVIGHEYTNVGDFHNGVVRVLKDEKWGYMNTSGEWILEPEYELLDDFRDGLGRVHKDDQFGWIDTKGNFVWEISG